MFFKLFHSTAALPPKIYFIFMFSFTAYVV